MSGEDDDGSLPHSLSAAITKLETKLGRGKSDRGKIYAHLLGFEDEEEQEMVPGRSTEDTYTKALVKLHAAVYALRDKGHRQAATALELLVHKKWLTSTHVSLPAADDAPYSKGSTLQITDHHSILLLLLLLSRKQADATEPVLGRLAIELLSELKPPLSSESSLEATLCSREYEDVRVTLPPRLFSTPSLYDVDAEASGTVDRGCSAGLEADISFLSGPPALDSNIFGDLLCTSEGNGTTGRGEEKAEQQPSASTLPDDPFSLLPPLPTDPSLTPSIFDDFLSFALPPSHVSPSHDESAPQAEETEHQPRVSQAEERPSPLAPQVGVQLRYEPQILVEKEVVECTLLMLLGVQSWLFTWDDVKEAYRIVPPCVRLATMEEASLTSVLHTLAHLGTILQRLHGFAVRLVDGEGIADGKLVWQAVGRGVQDQVRRWRERALALGYLPSPLFATQDDVAELLHRLQEANTAFSTDIKHHPCLFDLLPTATVDAVEEPRDDHTNAKKRRHISDDLRLLHVEQCTRHIQDCASFVMEALARISSTGNAREGKWGERMPCGGLECISYLYNLAADTLMWDSEPQGRGDIILYLFSCSWRPYAVFLERLLGEGVSPTIDPFRDFYHVIPSQDREGEWEDIIIETPRHLAHVKRDLCAIAFGLYILSREKTADAKVFVASVDSRPTSLCYPSLHGFTQDRGANANAEMASNWADIFVVKSPSQLGGSVYEEETGKKRVSRDGVDSQLPDEQLLARAATMSEGWMFLDAITQDSIASTVTERYERVSVSLRHYVIDQSGVLDELRFLHSTCLLASPLSLPLAQALHGLVVNPPLAWGVAQRRKINGMLRDTLSLHMGGHSHHDEQEETLQRGASHGVDVAIARGCDACYAQKLSFGFGIAEPGDQAAGTPQGPLSVLNELAWDYHLVWPAYLVVDRHAMLKINKLFGFLIKVQVAQLALSTSWVLLKRTRSHRQLNLPCVILQEMRHALSVLGEDTSRQVHHVYWRDFVAAFAEAKDVQAMQECLHQRFLDPALSYCFLNRESAGLLNLVEKLLSYALVMQRYAEKLAVRLSTAPRPRSYPDLKGKAAGSSASGPTDGGQDHAAGTSADALQLTESEAREFDALRSSFGQHVAAFLDLMAQLSSSSSSSSHTVGFSLAQSNFNHFYRGLDPGGSGPLASREHTDDARPRSSTATSWAPSYVSLSGSAW